jgi:competence protein ComEC
MRLVAFTVAWTLGLWIAATAQTAHPPIWLALAAITIPLALPKSTRLIGLSLLVFALGGLRYDTQPRDNALTMLNDAGYRTLSGVIDDEPDVRDTSTRLRVRVDEPPGTMLVFTDRSTEYRYGDRVLVGGSPRTPPEFDTFNYRDYLARGGVYTVMMNADVQITERDHGSGVLRAMFALKDRARAQIASISQPYSGLLTAILLGDDSAISPDVEQTFRDSNSTHLLAISGANFAILTQLLISALSRLRNRTLSTGIALVCIVGYTFFVGANLSVARAAIMGALTLIAAWLGRKSHGLTALAFSFLFITVIVPNAVYDLGLLFSTAATFGLVVYMRPLSNAVERLIAPLFAEGTTRQILRVLSDVVLIGLVAQVTVLPLSLLLSGSLPPYYLITSVLIAPVQAPILIFGVASVIVGLIVPTLGTLIAWIAALPLAYTLAVIRATPEAVIAVDFGWQQTVFYYAMLIGATMILSRTPTRTPTRTSSRRLAAIANAAAPALLAVGVGVAVLVWMLVISRPDGRLHLWHLEGGILIRTPNGAHILIDGGDSPTRLQTAIGERTPFTLNRIDVVILTQPKRGQVAALTELYRHYDIGVTLTNGHTPDDEAFRTFVNESHEFATEFTRVTKGYSLHTNDGVIFEIVHPARTPSADAAHDDSPLIVRVTFGDASFLVVPEVSADGLDAAVRSAPESPVLSISAQGTKAESISAWRDAVSPRTVILLAESGDANMPQIAEQLQGVQTFRTDQQGVVHVVTDGSVLWVDTAR